MKILNLFAGIGGNRTYWGNKHEIIAIEYNQGIADVYKLRFPNDEVIVTDAYDYFLDHFHEFDFIWASPPCLTHTRLVGCNVGRRYNGVNVKLSFPDLRLFSLIIFLQNHYRGKWLVENVKGYYKPFVIPTKLVGRHYFWSNIPLMSYMEKPVKDQLQFHENVSEEFLKSKGIDQETFELVKKIKNTKHKQIINNCVKPSFGKFIIDSLENTKVQKSLLSY